MVIGSCGPPPGFVCRKALFIGTFSKPVPKWIETFKNENKKTLHGAREIPFSISREFWSWKMSLQLFHTFRCSMFFHPLFRVSLRAPIIVGVFAYTLIPLASAIKTCRTFNGLELSKHFHRTGPSRLRRRDNLLRVPGRFRLFFSLLTMWSLRQKKKQKMPFFRNLNWPWWSPPPPPTVRNVASSIKDGGGGVKLGAQRNGLAPIDGSRTELKFWIVRNHIFLVEIEIVKKIGFTSLVSVLGYWDLFWQVEKFLSVLFKGSDFKKKQIKMRNGSHKFDLKNGACMKKCFNFLEDPRRRKGITLRKG